MRESPSKIVLPTVETCRWRRPPAGGAPAACGLVADLLGVAADGGLAAVADEGCAACCRSFPPTRRTPNPVVASLLHAAASRVLRLGGTAGCGAEAAARAREFAGRRLDLELPGTLRVTPARGTLPCAWLGETLATGGPGPDGEDGPDSACEHPDHDVASPARCRACPDWARHRPISRWMTPGELVPPPARRCGRPVRDWAVAVTTAPRRRPTLEVCLDGIARAGWDAPRLFLDGTTRVPPRFAHLPTTWREDGVGAWPAWYLALAELVVQRPEADAYLMLQDDVALLDRGGSLREHLEQALWPGDRPGMVSLFYTGDDTRPGWHRQEGGWHWGAQAFAFPPGLARGLVADAGAIRALLDSSPDHHTPIPTVLYEWAHRSGVDSWYATPSLAQHVGNASAIWDVAALTGGRRAPWFAGGIDEAFAVEEDLADFPEWAFARDPASRDAYDHRVGRGLDRMRGLSVVFCALCRDARAFLPRLAARVGRLGGLFRDYRVVVVDEGSADATPGFLADWRAANPRVDVLAGPGHPPGRDRYREHVAREYADFDHAIVVDADAAGGWSHDGVAHTFGEDGWDVVGSLGLARAPVAGPDGPRFRHHDPRAFVAEAGSPASDFVARAAANPGRGGPMLPVASCFGGLAVYRMACLRSGSYGGGDREHVDFHARLRRAGLGRIFLNPSQVVLHSPA